MNKLSVLQNIENWSETIFPNLRSKNEKLWILWKGIMHASVCVLLLFIVHYFLQLYAIHIFIPLSLFITYKEFIRDPQMYNQKLYKGISDWLSWIIPFGIYFSYFY